jgi:CheY-like chemotaxis protein
MATAVVCDDDVVARSAITVSCEEAGLEVVAETDSGNDAAELIRRFGVDVLVLDLSLTDGSGERTLERLNEEGREVAVVVFSAFANDPWPLLRLGVQEVIAKPDFELLQQVLLRIGSAIDSKVRADERRAASREVRPAPKMWRSPSGVNPHHELPPPSAEHETGHAAIAITVVALEDLEKDVGPLLAADCRLAVAAALRSELRIQDLLHEAPEVDGFIALLRGGDARSAGAVWSRLMAKLPALGLPGEVRGAASRVDSMGPADAVARVVGALSSATVASPSFLSV